MTFLSFPFSLSGLDTPGRVILLIVLLLVCGALAFLHHYAPLQPAFLIVYAGFGLSLLGLFVTVHPLEGLRLSTHLHGLGLLGLGAFIAVGGMLLPAPQKCPARPGQRIDPFMPHYTFHERHEVRVKASPARVMAAMKAVSLGEIPAARIIMNVRGWFGRVPDAVGENAPMLVSMDKPGSGFITLVKDDPWEFVAGLAGRPWRTRMECFKSPEDYQEYCASGAVKVAFNVRVEDLGHGETRLSTETRIQGNDAAANRIFGFYWRVIYPGSAIIRRLWMDAAVRRAEGKS